MRLSTVFRYLIGRRDAILTIAADRRALAVGLLFVLSAALARDYDGEDLVHEPWHLLVPVAASLAASLLLFGLTWGVARLRGACGPRFLSAYLSFLGLFWMTAPLAWLYAVPYERFLGPGDATRANLWTLGLVALWRVALMVRVVSVLMGYKVWEALCLVMTFADGVALAVLYLTPLPIINVMGGVRLSESEHVIQDTAFLVGCSGLLTLTIWLVGSLAAVARATPAWQAPPAPPAGPPARRLLALAAASVAVWAIVLPWTQPEQVLRRRVERDLRTGHVGAALVEMSAHAREDFPPQWDPPPRLGYGEKAPSWQELADALAGEPVAPWVRSIYLDKLVNGVAYRELSEHQMVRLAGLLRRFPEGPALADEPQRAQPHAHGLSLKEYVTMPEDQFRRHTKAGAGDRR
jgi:hypothetical protein